MPEGDFFRSQSVLGDEWELTMIKTMLWTTPNPISPRNAVDQDIE